MATTRFTDHLLAGDHTSRPAFGDVPQGTLYACSDHDLIYQSDGSTAWSTWADVGGTGGSGDVATDSIWTTAGMVAVATGTATATEQWPPGHEFDYAAITSAVNPTATSEATANTVVTGNAVTYDGSTDVWVEFFSHNSRPATDASGRTMTFWLYDGSSSIGSIGLVGTPAANGSNSVVCARIKITPTAAAHTYSIRASVSGGTGLVGAGAGGAGNASPAYIRITKA